MRQIAVVQDKGFYNNADWMQKLKTEAAVGNWLMDFDNDGKIIIKSEKSYIKELLTVLQNKLVQTIVDKQVCDVDGTLSEIIIR